MAVRLVGALLGVVFVVAALSSAVAQSTATISLDSGVPVNPKLFGLNDVLGPIQVRAADSCHSRLCRYHVVSAPCVLRALLWWWRSCCVACLCLWMHVTVVCASKPPGHRVQRRGAV